MTLLVPRLSAGSTNTWRVSTGRKKSPTVSTEAKEAKFCGQVYTLWICSGRPSLVGDLLRGNKTLPPGCFGLTRPVNHKFRRYFANISNRFMRDLKQQPYRSGGSVMDNTLDYQSRDQKIDSSLLRSFGSGFKLISLLRTTLLMVGR